MADEKLTNLPSVTPATGDLLYLVDISDTTDSAAGSSKKTTVGDVLALVSGGGTWGSITGTLSSQTDLQSALNAKQPLDSDLTSWAAVTRASGYDTFAATPSSANLAALLTDETGSGAAVFGTGPTLTSPVIAGSASTGILFGGSASTDVLLRKNAAVSGTPNLAVYSGNVGAWAVVSAATFRAGTDGIIWTAGGTGQWAALNDASSAFVGIKGSNLTATALINLGTYTVATLPSASANAGAIAQVTDANSTTNGGTVAGGGSNRVPVFSNGTNWIVK